MTVVDARWAWNGLCWTASSLLIVWYRDNTQQRPNPLHKAIMEALFQSFRNVALCCCLKGGGGGGVGLWRYHPDDAQEDLRQSSSSSSSSSPSSQEDAERKLLLKTSMKSRIQQYQAAMTKTEETKLGSGPSPYKPTRSTSNVIAQFETLATQQNNEGSAHPTTTATTTTTTIVPPSNAQRRPLFDSSSSSSSNHIPQQIMKECVVCLKYIYPTDATLQSFGKLLHATCFTCRLCQTRLTHHPLEVQFELPEDTGGSGNTGNSGNSGSGGALYCVCAKCQHDSMVKDKPKVLATTAGEKITVAGDELGDVKGVKDAIGDELEDILLEKTVPRCQLCGGDFLAYHGNVCMVGQTKYHQECWDLGRPAGAAVQSERRLTPLQAMKYLSDRWILRIMATTAPSSPSSTTTTTGKSSAKRYPLATLFFVWTNKAEDLKALQQQPRGRTRKLNAITNISDDDDDEDDDDDDEDDGEIQASLSLDDQAMGNPNYQDPTRRKTKSKLPASLSSPTHPITIDCEVIGNALSNVLQPPSRSFTSLDETAKTDSSVLVLLQLVGTKHQVKHTVSLLLPKIDPMTLDLTRAELTIALRQD